MTNHDALVGYVIIIVALIISALMTLDVYLDHRTKENVRDITHH